MYYNPYMTPKQEVPMVNGLGGAEAYNLAPNSSILLMDKIQAIVYLKVTDSAGYPSVTAYDITPHKSETQTLEERIMRLEEMLNAKSDVNSESATDD